MKWPKLLKKLYAACLAHDAEKEKELVAKALRKNLKARDKKKESTVTQVIVRD